MTRDERDRLMTIIYKLDRLKVAASREAERSGVGVNVYEIPALDMGDADFLISLVERKAS